MARANRTMIACALMVGGAGSALAGQQTESRAPAPIASPTATPVPAPTATAVPVPTPTPVPTGSPVPTATPSPAHPTWPSLPDTGVVPDMRALGTFATVEEAVAAARAAQLPAGTYGTATVGQYVLAIDAEGMVYLLAQMGGSGSPQRPPTPPKGQQ